MASAEATWKAASPLSKPPSEIANQVASVLKTSADQAQQLLDVLNKAFSTIPEPLLAIEAKIEADTEKEKRKKVRASKHEFRILNEIYPSLPQNPKYVWVDVHSSPVGMKLPVDTRSENPLRLRQRTMMNGWSISLFFVSNSVRTLPHFLNLCQ